MRQIVLGMSFFIAGIMILISILNHNVIVEGRNELIEAVDISLKHTLNRASVRLKNSNDTVSLDDGIEDELRAVFARNLEIFNGDAGRTTIENFHYSVENHRLSIKVKKELKSPLGVTREFSYSREAELYEL